MSLNQLKDVAARLGILYPDGHKGRKVTWLVAIRNYSWRPQQANKFTHLPIDLFGDIVHGLRRDKVKYVCTIAADTTMATERMTIDKALKSKDRYMQYGLSVTNDPKNHPVKKAILAFDDGETVDTVFAAYFTLIHAYIDQLSPDALHAYFKGAKSLKLTDMPVWVNGQFTAVSRTHNDDYLNFVVVLVGRKTFYVASPESIESLTHEARDIIPSNCEAAHLPTDHTIRHRAYKGNKIRMQKITLTPGTMLVIPPRWWHYVATDPETVMLNFWYQPADGGM